MIPIATSIFTFVSMPLLVAMDLAVLLISLAISLALPVTRIGQCSRLAADQREAGKGGNE
jgi:hypothetical protein